MENWGRIRTPIFLQVFISGGLKSFILEVLIWWELERSSSEVLISKAPRKNRSGVRRRQNRVGNIFGLGGTSKHGAENCCHFIRNTGGWRFGRSRRGKCFSTAEA